MPICEENLHLQTTRDPLLSKVMEYLRNDNGPKELNEEMQAYSRKRAELSCDRGLLLWGGRVSIPASLQENVLVELHASHIGSTHMK